MKTRLFTPGPTPVPEDVTLAMAAPLPHHRTPEFRDVLLRTSELLRQVFRTQDPVVTLTASGSEYKSSVERAIVRFERSDRFKISFGKYHTPINWWNTAYHHGLWLQTTVARPEMTQFGGDFIPVHFVGGLVEGSLPAGGVNLGYTAGLGNGRSSSVSGAGDSGDANDNRARLLGLTVRPDRLYSLQLGASFYRDRITLPDTREFRESIGALHVVWIGETPEVIVEFAQEDHRDLATGERHRSDAHYVQVAYRLPVWRERLKPYARYEKINVSAADPVLADFPDLERTLAGIRIDVADFVAVKTELRNDRVPAGSDLGSAVVQVSLAF